MTNGEKLKELFPDIPEYSGIDYWGDFWEEEYKDPKARGMTNKEWLVTLSPQEWYMAVHWLFYNYGTRYDNTYLAIIAWLEEKHTAKE